VTVSWEFLNKIHIQLQKNINHINTKFSVFAAKVVCLQKILDQINHHMFKKVNCLVTELNSDNDETENEINFLNMQQLINFMSSIFWNLILFLFQNVKVFSHSSWGFLWVFGYFWRYCTSFILQDSELFH